MSDALAKSMLDILVEFVCYEVIQDLKRFDRDKLSIVGRMRSSNIQTVAVGTDGAVVAPASSPLYQSRDAIRVKKEARKKKNEDDANAAASALDSSINTGLLLEPIIEENLDEKNEQQHDCFSNG